MPKKHALGGADGDRPIKRVGNEINASE